MILTKEEKDMLSGKSGNAKQKSMEIITALGEIYGADKLIDVKSVQVAGVSYHNLGDAGLEYLQNLAKDGKVVHGVTATLNPAGMDLKDWKRLGITEEFAKKQNDVIDAYRKLGISITCTCTPYLIGNMPKLGEHIAWSESSAVCYANSILGARTNREGGPSSLATALTGKTANYGFHLDSNRKAQIMVDVKCEPNGESDYSALGHAIGEKVKNKVLMVRGIKNVSMGELKIFCASTATYGATALFHIENMTPEWKTAGLPKDKITIDSEDLKKSYEFLTDGCDPDFISVGCPHCSIDEIKMISDLLKGKKVSKEFWIVSSRSVIENSKKLGYDKTIEQSGAKLVADTCMAVAPLKGRFNCLATNSAKACFYGRGSNSFKTILCSLEDCIKYATGEKKHN